MQVEQLDLASLRSVRAFAERWRRRKAPLHVLVNNAGMFSMGGAPWTGLGLCYRVYQGQRSIP